MSNIRYAHCAAAIAALALLSTHANAVMRDVQFDMGGGGNTVSLTTQVSVLGGILSDSDTSTTTLSGNLATRLDIDFGPQPGDAVINNVEILHDTDLPGNAGTRLGFSSVAFEMKFGNFLIGTINVKITSNNLSGTLDTLGGPVPVTTDQFGLSTTQATLDRGTLIVDGSGSALGFNGNDFDNTINMATDPITENLAGLATITVQHTQTLGDQWYYDVNMSAPFQFSGEVFNDGNGTVATLIANGTINSTQQIVMTAAEGDFNSDFVVDAEDLALLLGNWGQSSQPTDWTGLWDGFVDADELADLLGNWGAGISGPAPLDTAGIQTVITPEPATLLLLTLGGAAVMRRRTVARPSRP